MPFYRFTGDPTTLSRTRCFILPCNKLSNSFRYLIKGSAINNLAEFAPGFRSDLFDPKLQNQSNSGTIARILQLRIGQRWPEDGMRKWEEYFKVILPGPDGDFDRLRTPSDVKGIVPPSVESQLNQRQKQIMIQVQQEGRVTNGWCRNTFGVTYNTAYRDLSDLVERGLLVQRGQGRATRYELNVKGQ